MSKIQINEDYLKDLGLFSGNEQIDEKSKLLIFRMLGRRVQDTILEGLEPGKAKEFVVAMSSEDLYNAWTDKNVPGYEAIVQEQLKVLKAELVTDFDLVIKKVEEKIK